jgi:hypothetical protein
MARPGSCRWGTTRSQAFDEKVQEPLCGVGPVGLPGGPGHGVDRGHQFVRVEIGADVTGSLGAGQQVTGAGADRHKTRTGLCRGGAVR